MSLENRLAGWTGPSSDSEQEKQDRTERMIRAAIGAHPALADCSLRIFAKGSYANNTNVRSDSDVDIAVECTEVEYWDEHELGSRGTRGSPYTGRWTPELFRLEVTAALRAAFPRQVDASGTTAIAINSSSSRVDADVVPCFSYRRYMPGGWSREGTKIFKTPGGAIINYPDQQLENGRAKNIRTGGHFKRAVRILKRIENAMAAEGTFRELPSYFIECLAYNCPDELFSPPSWTDTIRGMLIHMWNELDGHEPSDEEDRWMEVNECFFLFHPQQKWKRSDGRGFAGAAWNFLGYT
jgi:hypothetical protein